MMMRQKLLALVLGSLWFTTSMGQGKCPLLINEILFNPPKDGSDFVELYNASKEPVDLSAYLIANRNSSGNVASVKKLAKNPVMLGASSLAVITEDTTWLRGYYFIPDTVLLLQLSSLPSFPDEEGTAILMSGSDSSICDELKYEEGWHFSLIDDRTGVALERISINESTASRYNWASAASSAGYGTPGRHNSQRRLSDVSSEVLNVSPKLFTPDNDGQDDYMQVSINPGEPGLTANAMIYDVSGRRAKYFLKNENLGTTNIFRWDGYDVANRRLPPGVYILITDVFGMRGQVRKFKNVIVIAYGER
jgi:hypothetical protein